ncbi:hypothetical protein [Paraburkholderia sp. J76]|uniref:hypothetical protein n=1 Tax=Paraburkholderia sp. J76 TaxID=2805439 RepID=UPI002ABDD1FD|nr:hypothetical protein [Paraburkholderia sp. J76]
MTTSPRKNSVGLPRLTIGKMQAMAAKHGGKCLSAQYVNARTHLEWECAEGHRWLARPNNIKNGTWCRICWLQRRRLDLSAIQADAQKRGGRCLSDEYVNSRLALLFECSAGHRWKSSAAGIRAGNWCQECLFAERRVTLDKIRAVAAGYGGECLSDTYDPKQPLRWRCAEGHEWEVTADHVRSGNWCPHCQRENRRRKELDRVCALAAERGGRCLSKRYIDGETPLEWQCRRGHTWRGRPVNVIRGFWCPDCEREDHSERGIERMRKLAAARGGECLSDTYVNVKEKLRWRCARGHEWESTAATVLTGCWCPNCAVLGRTKNRVKRLRYDFEGGV